MEIVVPGSSACLGGGFDTLAVTAGLGVHHASQIVPDAPASVHGRTI
ncbi:MAG: hypothetical protein ABL993_00265 [Vicinamibacterales bacterium]